MESHGAIIMSAFGNVVPNIDGDLPTLLALIGPLVEIAERTTATDITEGYPPFQTMRALIRSEAVLYDEVTLDLSIQANQVAQDAALEAFTNLLDAETTSDTTKNALAFVNSRLSLVIIITIFRAEILTSVRSIRLAAASVAH
jgi:hypothetical protein